MWGGCAVRERSVSMGRRGNSVLVQHLPDVITGCD